MNRQVIGVLIALLAGLGMGAGYTSSVHPFAGIGVVMLLLGAAVVWARPLWGLALMIALIPIEGSLLLDVGASLTRLLGVGVAGAWFLRKLIRGESWDRLLRTPVLVILALFFSYAALSSLWAVLPMPVSSEMFRLGMFVVFPVLIVDLVRSRDDAVFLVKAVVAGSMVALGMTLLQTFGPTYVRRAGEGVAGGINRTALLFTCLVPLAFYLLRATKFPWSLLGLAYVVLAPIAVAGTLSRMGLLLLTAIMGVELFHSLVRGRGRGRGVVLLVGAAGIAILAFVLPIEQLTPRLRERIDTIGPYVAATLNPAEGGIVASSPRGFHIQVAFAIFRDHPWLGAGYSSYPRLFIRDYQTQLWGADGLVYRTPRSPHGTLWGFLADLGLIGTAIWLSMIGGALFGLARSLRTQPDGASEVRVLGRSVLLFLLLFGGYHVYADVHRIKLFWLAFGLAVALAKVLRDELATASEPDLPRAVPVRLPAPEDGPVAAVGSAR